MITINPGDLAIPQMHQYLLGSIGPRPICFASTIDKDGRPNLSPFSFFNVFSTNPPILVFSPARSGRTGATKNTLDNVLEVPEVTINVVTHDMVQQMSLASSPYEKGVNEFIKSGFTPIDSEVVKPSRVAESPVQFECRVNEVVALGDGGGSGNLVICEILRFHVREDLLNEAGRIDQTKIDLVARMGGDFYCRAHGDALFEIPKPLMTVGVGVDQLPPSIRAASELTGNHLGQLGQLEQLPDEMEDVQQMNREQAVAAAIELLNHHKIEEAYKLLAKNLHDEQ